MRIKKLLFVCYITFSFSLITLKVSASTTIIDSIYSGGVYRSYKVYIPTIYSSSSHVPLVFNFHGRSSMNYQQEAYGDFRPVADTANFILVHPQGIENDGHTGWNNFDSVSLALNDITFISNLIDTLNLQFNINLNKVYSTGFSNGGFMSYDLACFLNNRFAAIASVAGSMVADHKNACNPQHPIPIMEIHGTDDPIITYDGTAGLLQSVNIDTLMEYWANHNNCSNNPIVTTLPDIDISDSCTVIHYLYDGGIAGSSVELYKIVGGRHSWPGTAYPFGLNTNMDFEASREIWNFFNKHSLTDFNTGLTQTVEDNKAKIYPNPSNGIFKVEITDIENSFVLIFNALGEKVLEETMTTFSTVINMSNQPHGIYFCRIKSQEGIQNFKLVITKA